MKAHDRVDEDLFGIEDNSAQAVATRIPVEIDAAGVKKVVAHETNKTSANDHYLKGALALGHRITKPYMDKTS